MDNMPDGSKPSQPVGFSWAAHLPTLPKIKLPSFRWHLGMKLPHGCQTKDGKEVPEGAETKPDGFVHLPNGLNMPHADITLPDGVALIHILEDKVEKIIPAAKMPDGTAPSRPFGFGWSSSIHLPKISLPKVTLLPCC